MAKANNDNSSKPTAAAKKNTCTKHSANSANKTKSHSGSEAKGAVLTILNKVAALKVGLGQEHVERKQLSALTGIQGKSTIANALTKLKNEAWMIVTPATVTITDLGMQAADHDAIAEATKNIPKTNAEYLQSVKDQHKLKAKAIQLIDFLQDGRQYEKEQVASAIDQTMNSTFANLLTSLKKLGIIEFDRKTIRLTDTMFPFEPRAEE